MAQLNHPLTQFSLRNRSFLKKKTELKKNASDLSDTKEGAVVLQHKIKIFQYVNLDFAAHRASRQIMVTVTE